MDFIGRVCFFSSGFRRSLAVAPSLAAPPEAGQLLVNLRREHRARCLHATRTHTRRLNAEMGARGAVQCRRAAALRIAGAEVRCCLLLMAADGSGAPGNLSEPPSRDPETQKQAAR